MVDEVAQQAEDQPATGDGGPLDLEALGEGVEGLDLGVVAAAEQRLAARYGSSLGRLADLAAWWAATRGEVAAPLPRRITQIGLPDPAVADQGRGAEAVRQAIAIAVDEVDRAVDAGTDLFLLTVEDDRGTSALAGVLMGLDPVELHGWPVPGPDGSVDDTGWAQRVATAREDMAPVRGLRGRPMELLEGLGSPALATATAVCVAAAARRTAVLVDGRSATVAALLARRCARPARTWWKATQDSPDRLHRRALESLQLEPLLKLDLTAQNGFGAQLALPLLRRAAQLLADV